MSILKQLWHDEADYVLSAEAVTVGTLGVAGATVGLSALSHSVQDELTETAFAIRSLDQSFRIPEQRGAGAWTAGSAYIQPDIEQAREELRRTIDAGANETAVSTPPVEHPSSLPDRLPDEHARLNQLRSEKLSSEEREELRRIQQRKRRDQQRMPDRSETLSPADAQ